ncbi:MULTISPECIES: DUF4436 domain-containing protein [Mycobacteriaceae]|uniref:DUF4436 domain-containing protein n=1 Tax=Mycobacteriaceae TaxID=1762 RepID=UPI0008024E25|nr:MULTISPECIES: DUF4436 domain-containing protein [Mycobacteriaceae]MCK0173205.1 DUF4436 domain-containing protein [Mycolicibacterium sp. F2034L]OBB61174.1 DUF4436 domain-containing protein [Mycobacterium sp. 852013-51886_SCH5428379]
MSNATQAAPANQPPSRRRGGTRITVIAVVLLAYIGSLFAYWWLSASSQELEPPNLDNKEQTVVLITVQSLKTVDRKLDVKVSVVPQDSLIDPRLDVLNTDISVRIYPWNTSGDLQWKEGESPGENSTTLDLLGESDTWPFDSYRTDMLSADVLVGSGDEREFVPARVEVEGAVDGWSISSEDGPPSPDSFGQGDSVQIELTRALGPLAFDLGICLVLITLPALAIFTSYQVITGRKEFQMPFLTWYAAMLFATVPLRNILPGAPPPGAWVDQALVLWVLVGLVGSMVAYVAHWYRRVP